MVTVFKCVFPDGKIFVGKTKRSLSAYAKSCENKSKKSPNSIFLWALSKNINQVRWIDLGSFWTSKIASDIELKWINHHKSYDREFGYNYLGKNGDRWSENKKASEKASLSRIRTRLLNLTSKIQDVQLKSRVESVLIDVDKYLNKLRIKNNDF